MRRNNAFGAVKIDVEKLPEPTVATVMIGISRLFDAQLKKQTE